MPDKAFYTVRDHSEETSTLNINIDTVTAANYATITANLNAFLTAMAPLSNGVVSNRGFSHGMGRSSAVPSDHLSRREAKYLVHAEDVTAELGTGINNPSFGRPFSYEIPCAEMDDATMFLPNTDYLDLTHTDVAAFVTAFEAVARSPNGGTLNVFRIEAVGRNL